MHHGQYNQYGSGDLSSSLDMKSSLLRCPAAIVVDARFARRSGAVASRAPTIPGAVDGGFLDF